MGGKKRTFGDRLSHAVFRWESAVTIALFILAFLLPLFLGWQWWHGAVLVILALAEALIVVSSLGDRGAKESAPAFDARTLRDPRLRQQVEKALEIRQRIEDVVQGSGDRALRDATAGLNEWIKGIVAVAQRLDEHASGAGRPNRAESELENTLAALGRVYIQLQLAQAGVSAADWRQHLPGDIAGQASALRTIGGA
ncbi:MAG: hypothetical protein KKA73_23865 [Chloroflexi bacterium]|nr:hypothetical protein [Chloroflexota bacterium]MBU1750730.1 hypothetical protein [Chloroflexota bacterium]MBU1879606.1 hypothetical protein [Chloroflexota bacterium]